jgi:hypothetical protein
VSEESAVKGSMGALRERSKLQVRVLRSHVAQFTFSCRSPLQLHESQPQMLSASCLTRCTTASRLLPRLQIPRQYGRSATVFLPMLVVRHPQVREAISRSDSLRLLSAKTRQHCPVPRRSSAVGVPLLHRRSSLGGTLLHACTEPIVVALVNYNHAVSNTLAFNFSRPSATSFVITLYPGHAAHLAPGHAILTRSGHSQLL